MRYMKLNASPRLSTIYGLFGKFGKDADDSLEISDEKASFLIKSAMSGVPPAVYVYRDHVVKGKEVLTILKRCFDGKLIFTGKLYEEINGKNYKELSMIYRSQLEEHYAVIVEIGIDSNLDELDYFLATVE